MSRVGKSSYKIFTESIDSKKAKLLKEAADTYRVTLRKAPRDVGSMHVLGLIECQLGNLNTAIEWFAKAIAIKPDFVDVQFLYGLAMMELHKYPEALVAFRQAQALAPDNIEINYNLGCALYELRQYDEAAAVYQRVLAAQPQHTEALNNLGNIANERGQFSEAISFYERVLAVNPNHIMANNNISVPHIALGNLNAAEKYLLKTLAIKPDYPEAHNNLGNVLRMTARFVESIAGYERAIALRPDYSEAENNLGNALKDNNQITEAIPHYRKSLRLKDDPDYHHNMALALLATGQFEEGWREYEWRWKGKQLQPTARVFTQPAWQGEAAAGRAILIHGEQGFGDTLQFCRYAPLVKARGFKVIMEVQPALVSLMTSLAGVDQLIGYGEEAPAFDLHCSMLSLPLALGTRLDSIPSNIPYLKPKDQAVVAKHNKLPATKPVLRVGLVWAGNRRGQTQDFRAIDSHRSIAPELLEPLIAIPDIEFYSLQKVGAAAPASYGLIDFMDDCPDFAATAALISNLDLVISVDTAVVHLAGAIGKPVWMLNRFNSCWRWLQDREDSPWYPDLRQFRQTSPGDWSGVIKRVERELRLLATPAKN